MMPAPLDELRQALARAGERRLGIMIVPEGHEQYYVQLAGRFGLLDWLRRKLRRG